MPSGRLLLLTTCLALPALGACRDGFVTDAPRPVTIARRAGAWRDTFAVRDTAILVLAVTLPEGDTLAGLALEWASSDPTVLVLAATQPAGTRADSLAAQLRTRATALRRGRVEVTARVTQPGFEAVVFRDSVVVLERWIAVSAGNVMSCGITVDSAAYCWGFGGLGDGELNSVAATPVAVVAVGSEAQYRRVVVSRHGYLTCGLVVGGLAQCWGSGVGGEAGDGEAEWSSTVPRLAVDGQPFATLDISNGYACGAQRLYGIAVLVSCWGTDEVGRLGAGVADTTIFVPSVPIVNDLTAPVAVVSTARYHACVALSGGLYCWGENRTGELGVAPSETPPCSSDSIPCAAAPLAVPLGVVATAVSAGGDAFGHTCALAMDGAVYCWGAGESGQLGAPPDSTCPAGGMPRPCNPVPRRVPLTFPATTLGAGGRHTCALDAMGRAWCWGANDVGQLGDGTTTASRAAPDTVSGGHRFVSLSVGLEHSCGVRSGDGAIFCWGENADCRVGRLEPTVARIPLRAGEPANPAVGCFSDAGATRRAARPRPAGTGRTSAAAAVSRSSSSPSPPRRLPRP